MIPKIIHYTWFGKKEKPKLVRKCIASWKKYCPDYEIIEWNEENFDIDSNPYTRKCYEQKQYAFLSDYVRLLVVYQNGGIYFDTDVEVIRRMDSFLEYQAFLGFETPDFVNTGIGFGAEKGSIVVKQMLEEYQGLLDGEHGVVGCPYLNTVALEKLGLKKNGRFQKIADAVVFPAEYFNPYDSVTGRLQKTEVTCSIHWYAASWMRKRTRFRCFFTRRFRRFFRTEKYGKRTIKT